MQEIKEIINEEAIWNVLKKTKNPPPNIIFDILKKASKKEGLSLTDVGFLLNTENPELVEKMFQISGKIKTEIYGERLVFFAPLYLSNFCTNNCEYCGFRKKNPTPRKKLTLEEVESQTKILKNMGQKRLLLEFGEHSIQNPIGYVIDVIQTIYNTKLGNGEIRRVNVNIAGTSVENYRKLKAVGIGTYQLFQETYHQETYQKLHHGQKANYKRQLFAHNNAMEAGIDDIGLGVLFGLFDYKFDTLALLSHSLYLEKKYGVGPHTISVPRVQKAPSVNMDFPYKVTEQELLKIISILRMAIPYTGMIITTREKPEIRAKAFKIGVSQTSAGSKTNPNGYDDTKAVEQFSLQDHRCIDEVLQSILKQNLLPSFCTACYRLNRTGATIMKLLKSGQINNLCRPNAILTFKEYLEDYASIEVQKLGLEIIENYITQIPDKNLQEKTKKLLKDIEQGKRDLYF